MRRINDGGYMKETIGNVLLNLDYYDGEDAYSDGSIEDRLLEIVKTTPKEDYQKVILADFLSSLSGTGKYSGLV